MPNPFSTACTELASLFDNLPDRQPLATDVKTGAQVVVLDVPQVGLYPIMTYLQIHQRMDAIHIPSHGQSGSLRAWRCLFPNNFL